MSTRMRRRLRSWAICPACWAAEPRAEVARRGRLAHLTVGVHHRCPVCLRGWYALVTDLPTAEGVKD
jgi:hypothetical protein